MILLLCVLAIALVFRVQASDISDLPSAAERKELPADGGERFNRLIHSSSPYLLQHAKNPVDWYEWGAEAFQRAATEQKPIFLSIGYSTCHWCHVMARESFADADIAALMNKHFICVKLDREERPDVDSVYMTFTTAMNQGRGGWPMSVWLTPELKPIYAGTYFPPQQFAQLIAAIDDAWLNRREEILAQSHRMTEQIREHSKVDGDGEQIPNKTVLARLVDIYERQYDAEEAGWGGAPKFPRPVIFHGLFPYVSSGVDPQRRQAVLDMCIPTLRAMGRGGMYDQLGDGFHRYSVDRYWHVPHYEKMLYDQGQLAIVYSQAWQLTGDAELAEVARGICRYVRRDMTHPEGAWFSAEDADSKRTHDGHEHAEGAFYVWTKAELNEVLGDSAGLFNTHYGVEAGGNCPAGSDPHGELAGQNTLIQRQELAESARLAGFSGDAQVALQAAEQRLLAHRAKRPRPHLDDKVLTAWNGLMLSGMSWAATSLGDEGELAAAQAAAGFLRRELYDADAKQLYRVWRDGERGETLAFAEDYAYLIRGLLDLYTADADPQWLLWARELQAQMDDRFWDDRSGGWFDSLAEDEHVLLRMKEEYDGAEPAASSMAIGNLLRLSEIFGDQAARDRVGQALIAFGDRLSRAPHALPLMVEGLHAWHHGCVKVVVRGEAGDPTVEAMLQLARRRYLPNRIIIRLDEANLAALSVDSLQAWAGETGPLASVCIGQTCLAPVRDLEALTEQLDGLLAGDP